MDTNSVFRKTPHGVTEIDKKDRRLPPKERLLLLLLDGKRTLAEITGSERDWGAVAQNLLDGGFVEIVHTGAAKSSPSLSLLDGCGQGLPSGITSTSNAMMAKDGGRLPPAVATPTPLSNQEDERVSADKTNWLTGTITRLSSLFTGVSRPSDSVRASPHAVETEDIDFFDITGGSDFPTNSGRSSQAMIGQNSASMNASPESLDDVPFINLEATPSAAPPRHSFVPTVVTGVPAVTKGLAATESVVPGSRASVMNIPGAALTVPDPAKVGVVGQVDADHGPFVPCANCPAKKSTLEARSFMKNHLWRLSGLHAKILIQKLDGCSSRNELQGLFELWLQNLLLTRQGCQEAPVLAAQLMKMLHE